MVLRIGNGTKQHANSTHLKNPALVSVLSELKQRNKTPHFFSYCLFDCDVLLFETLSVSLEFLVRLMITCRVSFA